MGAALQEAERAAAEDEVPVGAVLVHRQQILARAHNRVEQLQDASSHAEMLCLRQGAQQLGNWRLLQTTLYVTLEPCAMCLGMLLLCRVQRLVWAAPDLRQGACGSWVDLLATPHPLHRLEVRGGVLQLPAALLLRRFFQRRRQQRQAI